MDALTIVDLKRMHKAGLLTLDEFLKAAAPLIKQAGAGAYRVAVAVRGRGSVAVRSWVADHGRVATK
jgi:hypothetical protein